MNAWSEGKNSISLKKTFNMKSASKSVNKFWESVWRNCQIVRGSKSYKPITKDSFQNRRPVGNITIEHIREAKKYLLESRKPS